MLIQQAPAEFVLPQLNRDVSSAVLRTRHWSASCQSPIAANREKQLEGRIAQLEAKLVRKDEVIADISEEHVKLKKELGEL